METGDKSVKQTLTELSAKYDATIPNPANRANTLWGAIIGHGEKCEEMKKVLEELDSYDLTCFCIFYLAQQAASGDMDFLKEPAIRLMEILTIFHYDFYIPNAISAGQPGSEEANASNQSDEAGGKGLRIVR